MSNNLIDKIKAAINNLVILEIITAVGDIILKDGEKPPGIDYSKNPKVIMTRVNLLEGDITTIFHEEYVTGSYQSLRDFHAAREKEAYEMVKANIAALESLLKLARSLVG